ncbi:YchJ family protein [Hamadaea tsunoensis]|uniref:YchJ family protein n=1 Tax=Hamadaea tsunoensis TaxID=53368 RepID=UPI00042676BD|nr:YchJ family metal-binding protein [Hamadaea tsunoensis]
MKCPCGSDRPYADCCGPLHAGLSGAPTAETLMRSRYSAYARRDEAYLLRTWHPSTRPKHVDFEANLRWVRLDVQRTAQGSLFDSKGTVLFEAHYTMDGRPGAVKEHSTFVRENGEWLYVGEAGK